MNISDVVKKNRMYGLNQSEYESKQSRIRWADSKINNERIVKQH